MAKKQLSFFFGKERRYQHVCGVDEAGRGPLAGQVVAAAVILDPQRPIRGLDDSKKLSAQTRDELHEEIVAKALCYAVASASVKEIDELNILWASMLAMKRAVEALSLAPDMIYVDGNRCPDWHWPSQPIIGGDGKVQAIAAASILAKVSRDRALSELDAQYPGYGLARHKGYATPAHLEALYRLGPCPIHRKSFQPVSSLLAGGAPPSESPARAANSALLVED